MYSYVAAAVLAVLTLFTFYVFRDFGPQSVLRKFHIDIARQDWKDLEYVTLDPNSPATKELVSFVQQAVRVNASFEIVGVKRQGKVMLVVVEYRVPNSRVPDNWTWVVRQTSSDWRVDCEATLRARYRLMERNFGISG